MASGRSIKAGRAELIIGIKDVTTRGLTRLERRLTSFARRVATIGRTLAGVALGGGVFGAGAGGLFATAITEAGRFQETLNRFTIVFGQQADAARKFSEEFGERVGRSQTELLEFLARFQDVTITLGLDSGEASRLAQQLTELTVDLGSFYDIADDEVLQRLISGINGSTQALERLQINLREAELGRELQKLFGVSTRGATETQRRIGRINLILEQTAIKQGDATRTAGSFANQMKRLRGEVTDLAVAIGNQLIPVITPVITAISNIVQAFQDWADTNPQVIQQLLVGTAIVGGFAAAVFTLAGALFIGGLALTAFVAILQSIGTLLAIGSAAFQAFAAPIAGVVLAAGALVLVFGVDIPKAFNDMRNTLLAGFSRIQQEFGRLSQGIADALAAGEIRLAAQVLVSFLNLQFQRARERIDNIWAGVTSFFQRVWIEAVNVVSRPLLALGYDLGIAWRNVVFGIREVFISAFQAIINFGDNAFRAFFDRMLELVVGINDFIGLGLEENIRAFGDAVKLTQQAISDQRNQAFDSARSDREDAFLDKQDDARRRRELALNALEADRQRRQQAVTLEEQRRNEANAKAVQEARQAFEDSTRAAAEARAQAEAAKEEFEIPQAADFSGAGKAITDSLKNTGTFIGPAVERLFATDKVPEQQLEELKQIRQINERQLDQLFDPDAPIPRVA